VACGLISCFGSSATITGAHDDALWGAGCLRDHSRRFLDWLLRRSRRDQHYTDDCQHNHSREFSALDHILLVVNRNGLIINTEVFEANGTAERYAALVMLERIPRTKQVTVAGEQGLRHGEFRS
jgi:hypothetical protein